MSALNAKTSDIEQAWADDAGVETLRRMATVDRYNDWIIRRFAKHIGRQILEVGCGIGNLTTYFLKAERVTCIDLQPESVEFVRRQYAGHDHIRALVADIAQPTVVDQVGEQRFDTVVCINVLEHIEHDRAALAHMHAALRPGGKLLLFVPAGDYLYGQIDVALGHYRRYSLRSLSDLIRAQGFDIVDSFYMNVAGIPGWFLSSRVLKRSVPPRGLLRLFNWLTPIFVWFEDKVRPPVGQSVVCIAKRRGDE